MEEATLTGDERMVVFTWNQEGTNVEVYGDFNSGTALLLESFDPSNKEKTGTCFVHPSKKEIHYRYRVDGHEVYDETKPHQLFEDKIYNIINSVDMDQTGLEDNLYDLPLGELKKLDEFLQSEGIEGLNSEFGDILLSEEMGLGTDYSSTKADTVVSERLGELPMEMEFPKNLVEIENQSEVQFLTKLHNTEEYHEEHKTSEVNKKYASPEIAKDKEKINENSEQISDLQPMGQEKEKEVTSIRKLRHEHSLSLELLKELITTSENPINIEEQMKTVQKADGLQENSDSSETEIIIEEVEYNEGRTIGKPKKESNREMKDIGIQVNSINESRIISTQTDTIDRWNAEAQTEISKSEITQLFNKCIELERIINSTDLKKSENNKKLEDENIELKELNDHLSDQIEILEISTKENKNYLNIFEIDLLKVEKNNLLNDIKRKDEQLDNSKLRIREYERELSFFRKKLELLQNRPLANISENMGNILPLATENVNRLMRINHQLNQSKKELQSEYERLSEDYKNLENENIKLHSNSEVQFDRLKKANNAIKEYRKYYPLLMNVLKKHPGLLNEVQITLDLAN